MAVFEFFSQKGYPVAEHRPTRVPREAAWNAASRHCPLAFWHWPPGAGVRRNAMREAVFNWRWGTHTRGFQAAGNFLHAPRQSTNLIL